MRMLITGADGMLGTDLQRAAADAGLDAVACDRSRLDIADRDATGALIRSAAPDVVVNCAAWTDVDGAESSISAALAVNGAGAGNVAAAAASCGAWTIQVSSDYVFDGAKREPYVESDPVAPLSMYGRSKLEGELAVAREAPDSHTIVRSSWLFGTGGSCFPKTILRLASERSTISVVDDQVGCPTFTGHLADGLVRLAQGERIGGVVHVAAGGQCSWFEFASALIEAGDVQCEVRPATTAEYPRPAPRPAFTVMRSERPGAPVLPEWRAGLAEFMSAELPVR